jgi:predicted Zn-dependent peptidase
MLPQATMETLPNGLKIVFVPESHSEAVAFGLFVASGSRHETAKTAGISHFIEHMLFKGTAKRTALEISQAIEGKGGNFNAYTSEESTCFYSYLPSDAFKTSVDILTDMYVNASIPEKDFAIEKAVILEEIKMYDDEPDAVAAENLSRALFHKNTLGLPIAGSSKSLLPMTAQDLRDYMKKAYVPSATVAIVSGRFDQDEARKLIVSTLGSLKKAPKLKYTKVKLDAKVVPEIRVERDISQVQMAMGFKTFGNTDERKYTATVFDCMMGRTMSSRLFQAVREKRGLSYDIRSNLQFFGDVGGWTINAGLDSSRVSQAVKAIDVELDKIRQKKPSQAELRRTKDYLIGNFKLSMEQVRTRLFYFGASTLSTGKIVDPIECVEKIEAVTADEVQTLAQQIIDNSKKSFSWVTPKSK